MHFVNEPISRYLFMASQIRQRTLKFVIVIQLMYVIEQGVLYWLQPSDEQELSQIQIATCQITAVLSEIATASQSCGSDWLKLKLSEN